MTDGFEVTTTANTVTVVTESFTLVFDKDNVGMVSFKYDTSGTWHEGVESGTTPPTLFGPYFLTNDVTGGVLYPLGGGLPIEVEVLPWYVRINLSGFMRNPSIPSNTDFRMEAQWMIWPSGRIACAFRIENDSGSPVLLTEQAYRLNPSTDSDINPGCDDPQDPSWFGFYSNNTGGGENDLSHDAIVVSYQSVLNKYGVSGKINRIYRESYLWADDEQLDLEFLLMLSVSGSWGDCTSSQTFQDRGDALLADYRNPDPLDGSQNAGDVIVGVSGEFFEGYNAYLIETT